ncbi:MAG: hypothetical protein JWP89_4467 [Schlesneria sp.]|nr:hypothetical protein [Schlesneria sp.]
MANMPIVGSFLRVLTCTAQRQRARVAPSGRASEILTPSGTSGTVWRRISEKCWKAAAARLQSTNSILISAIPASGTFSVRPDVSILPYFAGMSGRGGGGAGTS